MGLRKGPISPTQPPIHFSEEAFVYGVLGADRLSYRATHRRLLAGIGARLAAQHCNGIPLLPQRSVIPSLYGGEAKAGGLACRRVLPGALGECRNGAGELSLGRRRRQ